MVSLLDEKREFDSTGISTPKRQSAFKALCIVTVLIITYLSNHYTQKEAVGFKYESEIFQSHSKNPLYVPIGVPTLEPSDDQLTIGDKAMVSSDVPLCSKMGKDILLKGGNAADAAITLALCVGSVNLFLSGIGGGTFIVSSLKEKEEVISIDAREMAPQRAFQEMYLDNPILSKVGGLAVAVPGELKGLEELYKRHGSGKLAWSDLLDPVIKLNREGFECGQILGTVVDKTLGFVFSVVPQLLELWDFIFKEDGKSFIEEGDFVKRKALANTLQIIADAGSSEPFYDPSGLIVNSLVKSVNRYGGILSPQDFANYQVNVEPALLLDLPVGNKNYKVFTSNGASSGISLLAGLNFYSNVFNESDSDIIETHKIIESMKWMASARSYFGDFSLNEINKTFHQGLVHHFTSPEWPRAKIDAGKYSDKKTFPWESYNPKYELTEPHGTTHLSVVDSQNNAVSLTTTLNLYFGSMIYDNKTGIILNNEMDDFSMHNAPNAFNLTPSIFNFIEPGKRPLSSMCPTVIQSSNDGEQDNNSPALLIGASGGSKIVTAVFHAIVRTLFSKMDLLHALAYPRIHHQLIPEYVMVENNTILEEEHELKGTTNIRAALGKLGHAFIEIGALSSVNAIKRNDNTEFQHKWEGVSDFWRKRGGSSGY